VLVAKRFGIGIDEAIERGSTLLQFMSSDMAQT